MSHTIVLSYHDKQLYKSTCDNFTNKIKEIQKCEYINQNEREIVNDLENNVQTILNIIKRNYISEGEKVQLLSSVSSIEKQIANLYNIVVKSNKLNSIIEKINTSEINKFDLVSKHGVLAIETIEYLTKNNIMLTNENFNKYIEKIGNEKLEEEKLNEYINNSIEQIRNSLIPDVIKIDLINIVRNQKDINLIKDNFAVIESKENEYLRLNEFMKKLIETLGKQGFKINSKSVYKFNENENTIECRFNMVNLNNNTVQFKLDSNNNFSYKLGNYVGHACEKTTEKLINDLKKLNIEIEVKNIKRDYEYNEREMEKEITYNK